MLQIDSMEIDYGPVRAVRGVSLAIGCGEIVALLGANGAGKTSLLRGVMGLTPARGRLQFEGRDLRGLDTPGRVAAGLAMAPEGRQVFTDQTVYENLLLGGHLLRHDRLKVERQIEGFYDMFPRLRERREQVAGTLSGGEQQMLAIARALMSNPRLLILDEPSLGLAPLVSAEIFRSLRQLRDAGMTILLVEQMANQALAIADRAYVLEGGAVALQGPAGQLRRDERIRAAYLGGGLDGAA